MSNNNNFDETMERLNQYYEQMPTQSSSANIMANIKKKKKRNWARYYQRWQVAALIVLMIGIGYVLGASQLSGQRESAHHLKLSTDQGVPEESMSIAAVEEEGETFNEEMDATLKNIPQVLMDDDTMSLEIINEEGFEEVIQVKTFVDDILGFTTKYDHRLVVEEAVSNEGRAIQWFFQNDGGRVEPIVLEIFESNYKSSYGQQVERYRTMMNEQGYTEVESTNYFSFIDPSVQVIEELQFEKDEVYEHVISVEQGERYYFFKTSSFAANSEFIEYSEGFGRNVKVIFEQFSWMYN